MKDVSTLKDLDVKPGDVVEWPGICEYVVQDDGVTVVCTETGRELKDGINYCGAKFRIISRASDKPKLWRDMTDAEKGALLLAAHDGRVIEYYSHYVPKWDVCSGKPIWSDGYAYRIKPELKVEAIMIYGSPSKHVQWCLEQCGLDTHRITFNIIDGKPDCASIKMEAL